MADVKISGLPASTLPLAGTEVLPLVQSGVTKKVASDDLTVKNVRSNATTGILQIAGPAVGTTRVMTTPNANFTAARTDTGQTFSGNQVFTNLRVGGTLQGATTTLGSNASFEIPADGTNRYIYMSDWFSGGSRAAGAIKLRGDGATADRGWSLGVIGNSVADFNTGFSARLSCLGSNDVTVDVGNLVIGTSGKGIDFSATAGTGTSELLDDYETGTFSPTVVGTTTAGTATYGVNGRLGTYTKIGNSVTVQIILNWTAHTGTGNINITGLPFTCKALYSASTTPLSYNLTLPAGAYLLAAVTQNSAIIELFQKDVNAAGGVWGGVAMDTNVDALIINVTYTV